MGDYLMNSIFAADLLKYVFQRISFPWENPYASILEKEYFRKSRFDSKIGTAVYTVWMKNEEDIEACYCELREESVDNKEAFGKYALSAADSYFSEGYSHGSFLGYCAIVLGVVTYYYDDSPPRNGIPEIAAEVIALVLLAHQLTGQFYKHGGWDGLCKISMLFNNIQFPGNQTISYDLI